MNCKFTEDISLLMDGELNVEQARQVQSHLSACAICQQVQADFLRLRQEIQNYQSAFDTSAQQQALRRILNNQTLRDNKRSSFWSRKIALPVPALALIALLFVALSLWAVFLRSSKSKQSPEIISHKGAIEPAINPFDVSRFDKGGRAVIYTERRTPTNDQPQKEIKQ
jgi:anti-sigma factor RsiW